MAVAKTDYLSRDFDGLKQSMLSYAAQVFPDWQPASEGDLGMVILELFAYMGDIVSYYTDRAQFENYLPTATQRDSILNLAFMLGYVPNSGSPAIGTVSLTTDSGSPAVTVPAGTQITTNRVEELDGPVVFEVDDDVVLPVNTDGTAVPVVANVTEGTSVAYQYIGQSSGQPGQIFLIPNTGVYRDTIRVYIEDGTGFTLVNEGSPNQVTTREWTRVEKLLEADDVDRVFEARYTSTSSSLYFGDDINGVIPATGLRIYASYRYGVGGSGNVPSGTVRLVNTSGQTGLGSMKVATDVDGLALSSIMQGGADPETDDSIRYNAPRVYKTQDRAVTQDDFVQIALGTEGVTRASVVSGTFTSVTVFITGADGGSPGNQLKLDVAEKFAGKTLAGVTVQVASPTFVPVNFGTVADPVVVEIQKPYSMKTMKVVVQREIRSLIAKMAFGEKMAVGPVIKRLMAIEGVISVEINVMARQDSTQSGHVKITPKPWEVFSTGDLNITVTGGS